MVFHGIINGRRLDDATDRFELFQRVATHLQDAGLLNEPIMPLASATGSIHVARATAAPPLLPPAHNSVS